jgi:hypothetical protein
MPTPDVTGENKSNESLAARSRRIFLAILNLHCVTRKTEHPMGTHEQTETAFLDALNRTVRAYSRNGRRSHEYIQARRELIAIGQTLEAFDRAVVACGNDRGVRA